MNVVKCMNGHFFDGDSYPVCPHCGAPAGSGTSMEQVTPKRPKGGFFGKHRDKLKTEQSSLGEHMDDVKTVKFDNGNSITGVLSGDASGRYQTSSAKKNITLDFWQTPDHESSDEEFAKQDKPTDGFFDHKEISENMVKCTLCGELHPSDQACNCCKKHDLSDTDAAQDFSGGAQSLNDMVKKASANAEGKTMSYFSSMTEKSETSSSDAVITDPVVGWLVSVSGKHFGQSFQIGAGKNSIGRGNENRIRLDKDHAVSRNKHAIITYEPKKRNFYIQPGDSSGLTYLNDEYITETKQIRNRDVIEIGDSKLIFIPFCSEEFTWEDYITKE